MSNLLTPEAIMNAAKAPETTTVVVPEWGGSVTVKGFTRAEMKALRKQCTITKRINGKDVEDVDSDKLEELLFLDGLVEPKLSADHWRELQNRAAGGVETILKAITTASGLTREEVAETKAAFPAEDGAVA